MAAKDKKLYISGTDKMWLGVCGGLAEYVGTDATLIRLIWVMGTLFTGLLPGFIAYLACGVIIPKKPA